MKNKAEQNKAAPLQQQNLSSFLSFFHSFYIFFGKLIKNISDFLFVYSKRAALLILSLFFIFCGESFGARWMTWSGVTTGVTPPSSINNYSETTGGAIYVTGNAQVRLNGTGGNLTFENNSATNGGGGVASIDSGRLDFNNFDTIRFQQNSARVSVGDMGGGVFYLDNAALSITSNRLEFINNSAIGSLNGDGGGAIHIHNNSVAEINSAIVIFEGNRAEQDGPILVMSGANSKMTFSQNISSLSISNSIGRYTSAVQIHGQGSSIDFFANKTYFVNNSATDFHGMLRLIADNSVLNFEGKTANTELFFLNNYTRNQGSIITIDTFHDIKISFANLKLIATNNRSASDGGIIYNLGYNALVEFTNSTSVFTSNSAQLGGIIYLDNASAKVVFDGGSIEFTSNVSLSQNSEGNIAILNGNLEIKNIVSMIGRGNRAASGGFMYMPNTNFTFDGEILEMTGNIAFGNGVNGGQYGRGGAFYITNSIVTFSGDNMKFIGNTASSGAVLYATNNSSVTFTGRDADVLFEANITTVGKGVLMWNSGSEVGFTGLNTLTAVKNTAIGGGGFLYIENAGYVLGSRNIDISGNYSPSSGGAIYLKGSNFTFDSNSVSFDGNISLSKGGAFYFEGSSAVFSAPVMEFKNNRAAAGSVLYATGKSSIVFADGDLLFESNVSENGNGTIIWEDSAVYFSRLRSLSAKNNIALNGGFLYISNSQFDIDTINGIEIAGNMAELGSGGALYMSGSTLTLSKLKSMDNNYSASHGGAIYLVNNSLLTFTDSALRFTGNTARNGSGGVFYVDERSSLVFSAAVRSIDAVDNAAGLDGGFAYLEGQKYLFRGFVFTARNNVSSGSGGVFYLKDSSFTFDGNEPVLVGNVAKSSGGMFYLNNSTLQFRNIYSLVFSGGRSLTGGGGVFYVDPTSVLSFDDKVMSMRADNNSGGSGGFAYLANQNFAFENMDFDFERNTALRDSGGVFYLDHSSIVFTGDMGGNIIAPRFIYNTAFSSGGAVFLSEGSLLNFNNYDILNFSYNSALHGGGGAFYVSDGSSFSISNVNAVSADRNYAFNGGFMYLDNYKLGFTKTELFFSYNTAENNGGVFYLDKSSITFNVYLTNTSSIQFLKNISLKGDGSVLYATSKSSISINARIVEFIGNTALKLDANTGGRGTVYLERDADFQIVRATTVTLTGNTAGSGGVFYMEAGSNTFVIDAYIRAVNNAALYGSGGVFYIDGKNVEIRADRAFSSTNSAPVLFAQNSASEYGGVFYITGGGELKIDIQSLDMLFTNNRMGNGFASANDVYIDRGTFTMNIQGGRVLQLDGGIISKSASDFIRKDNIASAIVGGVIDITGYLYVVAGSFLINLQEWDSSEVRIGALFVDVDNVSRLRSGVYSSVRKSKIHNTIVNNAVIEGGLGFGVDFFNDKIDSISVSTYSEGALTIDSNTSELSFVPYAYIPYDSSVSSYLYIVKNSSYTNELGIFGGTEGAKFFSNFSAADADGYAYRTTAFEEDSPFPTVSRIQYRQRDIIADFTTRYDFEGKILGLTHNQNEIARTFDSLTSVKDDNAMYALLQPLSELIYNDYLARDGAYINTKRMFDNLSGRFLANILTAGAVDNSAMLYTKTKPVQEGEEVEGILQSVWLQGDMRHFRYFGAEANDGDFKSLGQGLQAGFPIWRGRHNIGLFLGYNHQEFTQGLDNAAMSDIQFGVYGGLFKLGGEKNINLKGNIAGGIQYFNTERDLGILGFPDKPTGDFKTYSIRYSAESEYVLVENRDKERVFKPFAGLHGGIVFNSAIMEYGGKGADLGIEEGVYSRLNGLLGFRIEDLVGDVNWNLKAYLAYLFMGDKPQYNMYLEQIPNSVMDICGTPQEQLNGGVGFWLDYKISKSLALFTSFDLTFANRMFGYYVNAGINYKIFGNFSEVKSREEAIKDRRNQEKTIREAQIREERQAFKSVEQAAKTVQKEKKDLGLSPEDYAFDYETDFDIEIAQDLADELASRQKAESGTDAVEPQKVSKSKSNQYPIEEKSFRMTLAYYDPNLKIYELDSDVKLFLDKVIADIKKYKYTRVTLLANGGERTSGQDLAAMRMDVIYEYFYINGIDIDKIDAVDVGKSYFEGIEKDSVERNTVEVVVDYLDF